MALSSHKPAGKFLILKPQMEKEPLLGSEELQQGEEAASFLKFLSKPFQCFPLLKQRKPTYSRFDIAMSESQPLDFDQLPDLPWSNVKVTSSLSTSEKLEKIRRLMKEHSIAVYLVPSEDEHQSEETALSDKRREFLSGFTGSAGICVVTLDDPSTLEGEAALSTDGRYFLQAEKQLDLKYWRLLKQGAAGYPSWQKFAIEKAAKSKVSNVISCDPKFLSLAWGEYFEQNLKSAGALFKPLAGTNLVDIVWGSEKPPRTMDPVYHLPLEYSGERTEAKLGRVRDHLKEVGATHIVISALDDIGWLLNLRADTDIPFSPFFFSYVIVSLTDVTLYAQKEKLVNVDEYLKSIQGLLVKLYDSFYSDLGKFKASIHDPNLKLILPSKDACNYALVSALPQSITKRTIVFDSVVATMKLFKNRTELMNAKIAQTKDSLAFIIFSSWLEHQLIYKKAEINEYEAAQKIYSIRSKFPHFKGLSYETISSSGPNAAIIHYAPSAEQHDVIDPKVPYLIDSGGHYLEGSTDITRTFKFGDDGLTKAYQKYYTLVLKGHLAVAVAKFPSTSSSIGTILDSYARQPLWNEGLDFNHGTGHGIGSFGNVHEGPLYILTTAGGVSKENYFKKGAILTDEPGYYIDGECGFRVESEVEIIECEPSFGKTRDGSKYLGFSYLTKVPFCLKLIDSTLLSPEERDWINEFHRCLRALLGPQLLRMGEKRAHAWLMKETTPI